MRHAVQPREDAGEVDRRSPPQLRQRVVPNHRPLVIEALRADRLTQPRVILVVHLHAVIRLDRAMPAYRATEVKPPPARFDVELLEDAIRATVAEVRAPLTDELGGGTVQWGDELDIRQLDAHARRHVAGYLAKYATKSTEQAGGVAHRVTEHQLDALPVREHVRAYMRTAFTLATDPTLAKRRFAPCAHALGYRGHCLTKSRRYSTTFKALRDARERHVHEQILARSRDAVQRALAESAENQRSASFRYVRQGHLTAADAFLAASAAARAREQRYAAREVLCDHPPTREETRCESPQ